MPNPPMPMAVSDRSTTGKIGPLDARRAPDRDASLRLAATSLASTTGDEALGVLGSRDPLCSGDCDAGRLIMVTAVRSSLGSGPPVRAARTSARIAAASA